MIETRKLVKTRYGYQVNLPNQIEQYNWKAKERLFIKITETEIVIQRLDALRR